jgi:hypothetical protein
MRICFHVIIDYCRFYLTKPHQYGTIRPSLNYCNGEKRVFRGHSFNDMEVFMKKFLGAFLLVFLLTVSVNATIDSYNCAADGDGVIEMGAQDWSYNSGLDEYTLAMDCAHKLDNAGHVFGEFVAPSDPKVWIIEEVDNQTSFAWTGYQIVIGMDKDFTISGVMAPDDWTYVITAPAIGMVPNGGGSGYVGVVTYSVGSGSAIGIGQSGDFGFKIVFDGTVNFCTEQTPIPEPATMGLLSIGAMALLRKRK